MQARQKWHGLLRDGTPSRKLIARRRVGMLETPVRVYDLSEGGCFVTSLYDGVPGESLTVMIQLPYEGWIKVEGETAYNRPGYGFALRFTKVSDHAQAALKNTVRRLENRTLQSV